MTDTEARSAQPEATTLSLVAELAHALRTAGVRYCHWKSNEALHKSASGENDLDLLVARQDASAFTAVLHRLGFRSARPPTARQLPGVIDYYGLDEPSARIVHVHAHYQLVLGDDMTKNFRLPIEAAYLRSIGSADPLPVPAPEFEYVVFILRMVVKHASWDAQAGRKGRLSPSERRELTYLEARTDPEAATRILDEELPFVGQELFRACRRAVAEGSTRAERALVAQQLLHRLDSLGRRAAPIDLALRMWRRRWRKIEHRFRGSPRKRLVTGGLLMAVVGGDGAGKSSAVEMITDLLSDDFVTKRVHLGRPPRSRISRAARRITDAIRGDDDAHPTRQPAWQTASGSRFPGYTFMFWHMLIARDRYLAYRRARRATMSGAVVVCDRYPIPGIRLMDGPRTTDVPGLGRRPLARALMRTELRYYRRILPPDLLIVLRVDPQVAADRRVDDREDFVLHRAGEVYEHDWSDTGAAVIDAAQPIDDVWAQIRSAVWSVL
jgi:thymidylate kinase